MQPPQREPISPVTLTWLEAKLRNAAITEGMETDARHLRELMIYLWPTRMAQLEKQIPFDKILKNE